jgi:hypothetical protein
MASKRVRCLAPTLPSTRYLGHLCYGQYHADAKKIALETHEYGALAAAKPFRPRERRAYTSTLTLALQEWVSLGEAAVNFSASISADLPSGYLREQIRTGLGELHVDPGLVLPQPAALDR